jgi:hypothetical protein
MTYKTFLPFCLLLFLFTSCASTKNASKKTHKREKTYAFQIPEQYVFQDWIKFKSELSVVTDGEKITLDAQFRIKQNQIIWVTVSKIGFPLAKLYLTPDSVFMIDSFHKKYLKGTYQELSNKLGSKLNFNLVQNMVLGQIIKEEGPTFSWFTDSDLQLSTAPRDSVKLDSTSLVAYSKPYSIQKIDTTNKLLKGYYSEIPERSEALSILFNKRDTTFTYPIPNQVTISVFKNSVLKMICNLAHQKIELLAEVKTPFEIPEDYVKMD